MTQLDWDHIKDGFQDAPYVEEMRDAVQEARGDHAPAAVYAETSITCRTLTLNYSAAPHVDKGDFPRGFISWTELPQVNALSVVSN